MRTKTISIVCLTIILAMAVSAHAQVFTILTEFDGGGNGSAQSASPLARDAEGNLYGASASGGTYSNCYLGACGTIYKLDPTGKVTMLYSFEGTPDGSWPVGVALDPEGNLYGTTEYGGTSFNNGVVFKVSADGKETVLHRFAGSPDGAFPYASLIRDAKGNLYGTTYLGGKGNCFGQGCGTVYKIDPAGEETVLYRFDDGPDGAAPLGNLLLVDGVLYGTTGAGGTGPCTNGGGSVVGCGTVFKLEGHKETVLYKFQGPPDGYWPIANLVRDREGNLYGTTSQGGNTSGSCGALGCGIVFKLDPTGKETILYTFTGQNDGASPQGLVIDSNGNLYGTASVPGSAFEIDTSGKFTLLHSFNVQGQGDPGNLIIDAQGDLYGPAAGMVFKLTP